MATVNKKPAAKKKAAPKKAAAAKKPPVDLPAEEQLPAVNLKDDDGEKQPVPEEQEKLPEDAKPKNGTNDELSDMIASAVAQGVADGVKAALSAIIPPQAQAAPDLAPEPSLEADTGFRDPNMMTTYREPEVKEDHYVDLDMLDLTDPIAAQLAREDGGPTPGGKRVEAQLSSLESAPLTPDQIAEMTDEQIEEYNRAELRRLQARKQAQVVRRSELERMNRADRIRALQGDRDPTIIREADNLLGERMVTVVSIRKIGLGEQGTSEVGETIRIPLSGARKLQDSGAVKVQI